MGSSTCEGSRSLPGWHCVSRVFGDFRRLPGTFQYGLQGSRVCEGRFRVWFLKGSFWYSFICTRICDPQGGSQGSRKIRMKGQDGGRRKEKRTSWHHRCFETQLSETPLGPGRNLDLLRPVGIPFQYGELSIFKLSLIFKWCSNYIQIVFSSCLLIFKWSLNHVLIFLCLLLLCFPSDESQVQYGLRVGRGNGCGEAEEVEDGLFWHHSFEVAAEEAFVDGTSLQMTMALDMFA